MISKSKTEYLKFGFVAYAVLVSINLWSFRLIPDQVYRFLELIGIIGLLLIIGYNSFILNRKLNFKSNVLFFILIPVISSYGALVYHDQPLSLSLFMLRIHLYWLLYFVLHLFDISVEKIIKLLLFVGVVWVFITVVQQFTYPTYYFWTKADTDTFRIYRAGVYRFTIYGQQYGAFLLLYSFYQYLIGQKNSWLLLVVVGLLGFYYFGWRQFAISIFVCMCISVLIVKGRAQMKAVSILMLLLPLLFLFWDKLFSQYVELTHEQWQYGEDQRKLSANFYLFEYWPHWTAKIIGNGPIHVNSGYGWETEMLRYYFHYFRSDVGIIGAFNAYGIFHVINIIYTNIKIFINKYVTYENMYLKLLFFYFIIILLTSEFYSMLEGIPFYCILFYLTDKSVEARKASLEAN